MKKEDIKIEDIQRILFGNASAAFALEVLIRTVIVYVGLLLALKLLGKRMTGQLTITEMAVMITLGAIVSVPMQIPQRGILQGLLILLLAVSFLRGLNFLSFKKAKAEEVIQGKVNTLVKDGVLNLDAMGKLNISRQQLFSVLRNKGIFNLGKVRRVYLEACGMFTVYKHKEEKSGLPIIPPHETTLLKSAKTTRELVCCSCGKTALDPKLCENCRRDEFTQAII